MPTRQPARIRRPQIMLLGIVLVLALDLLWAAGSAAQDSDIGRADALDKQVVQLYRQGRYADAIALATQSLRIRENTLGPEHPDLTPSLNNLAELYRNQGRYAEAEPLYKRCLAIREKALGAEHPDVAETLNNLALLYDRQGQYTEAEPLLKRSVAIYEKALGSEHPHLAVSLNNLAALYRNEGRYKEAEPLFRRSLAILEKARGPEHPDVASSLNNLAALYRDQGRYDEAEPLYQRSLVIREKARGPEHPDVAVAANNLALLHEKQGRYAEAESLYKRSLAIWQKALGSEHPNVALGLNNLAALYEQEGRYPEAEPLYKRSLSIREKTLGPGHPDVAASLNNLALLYNEQSRYAEAEPLYRRSLSIREETLGPEHPDLAGSLNNLAGLYVNQGRFAEAEPLYKRSLTIHENAFGSGHPDVALSLNNLAELYNNQARYAEAEPLYRQSLAIREKTLGPDHPDVANSLSNLAVLYDNEDRKAEAEPLYQRSLAIREKAFGPDHPDVALSLNNLAELYRREARYADAEPLYQRSSAIYEKSLGPNHPDVAQSLNNLAMLYDNQGRYAEAYTLSGRAVDIMAKRIASTGSDRSSSASERRQARNLFVHRVALAFEEAKLGDAPMRESFRVAQLASASSVAQAVAEMAVRFAAGSDALAAAIRERQDLAGRWRYLDAAIVDAASKPPAPRAQAAEAALRQQFTDAETQLNALSARITLDFPQYAELSNPKPLEIGEVQALLNPDEAMLVYLVGEKESWLWALRQSRGGFYKLDIGAKALSAEVARLRERLDPALNPDLAPFDVDHAHALYEKIVAPAAPLFDGAHRVLIVPDGALDSLPLGVLITQAPTAEPREFTDYRRIAWLARDHALSVLPSVGTLRALRQSTSGHHAGLPFVGIGNPKLGANQASPRGVRLASLFRGALADVDAVRALPSLPETADELRKVAKAMGASEQDLYLGQRASEPLLRRAGLDRYRVIEFATHGLMSGDLEGLAEPALVLTPPGEASPDNDGLLTASKIATFKLDADWVVLSACNTAASDGTPDAGGLSGLAKAFFYAGARALLVSHWSVPSKATVELITDTFDELEKNSAIGRAEALHRAEMAMLDPTSPPEFAHPMMWGPFVLAGEGGAGR